MLSLAILLLLGSLAVADAEAPKCDPSYIHGPAGEFTFDVDKKELTCNDGKAIEYNRKRYEFLECDDKKGWNRYFSLEPPVKANEKLEIKCVIACHKSLITGLDNKLTFQDSELKCQNNVEFIKFTDAGKEIYIGTLFCSVGDRWRYVRNEDAFDTTKWDTDAITVSCVAMAKCDDRLISLGEGVKREKNKLTCMKPQDKLSIPNELTKARYDDLTCTVGTGWWTSGKSNIQIKNDYDDFFVKCGGLECDASLINAPPAEFTLNKKNELTCNGGNAIEYNQKHFSELKCNYFKGWLTEKYKQLTPPVKGEDKLDIKCLAACQQSMIKGYDSNQMTFDGKHLTCSDYKSAMIFMDNGKEKITSSLFCNSGKNWEMLRSKYLDTSIKSTDQISVSCASETCHELLVALGEGVKRENNKITCVNPDAKFQIDEDPMMYSDLTCTEDGWFTSGNMTEMIKLDFEYFNVKCEHKLPTSTTEDDNSVANKGQIYTVLLILSVLLVIF